MNSFIMEEESIRSILREEIANSPILTQLREGIGQLIQMASEKRDKGEYDRVKKESQSSSKQLRMLPLLKSIIPPDEKFRTADNIIQHVASMKGLLLLEEQKTILRDFANKHGLTEDGALHKCGEYWVNRAKNWKQWAEGAAEKPEFMELSTSAGKKKLNLESSHVRNENDYSRPGTPEVVNASRGPVHDPFRPSACANTFNVTRHNTAVAPQSYDVPLGTPTYHSSVLQTPSYRPQPKSLLSVESAEITVPTTQLPTQSIRNVVGDPSLSVAPVQYSRMSRIHSFSLTQSTQDALRHVTEMPPRSADLLRPIQQHATPQPTSINQHSYITGANVATQQAVTQLPHPSSLTESSHPFSRNEGNDSAGYSCVPTPQPTSINQHSYITEADVATQQAVTHLPHPSSLTESSHPFSRNEVNDSAGYSCVPTSLQNSQPLAESNVSNRNLTTTDADLMQPLKPARDIPFHIDALGLGLRSEVGAGVDAEEEEQSNENTSKRKSSKQPPAKKKSKAAKDLSFLVQSGNAGEAESDLEKRDLNDAIATDPVSMINRETAITLNTQQLELSKRVLKVLLHSTDYDKQFDFLMSDICRKGLGNSISIMGLFRLCLEKNLTDDHCKVLQRFLTRSYFSFLYITVKWDLPLGNIVDFARTIGTACCQILMLYFVTRAHSADGIMLRWIEEIDTCCTPLTTQLNTSRNSSPIALSLIKLYQMSLSSSKNSLTDQCITRLFRFTTLAVADLMDKPDLCHNLDHDAFKFKMYQVPTLMKLDSTKHNFLHLATAVFCSAFRNYCPSDDVVVKAIDNAAMFILARMLHIKFKVRIPAFHPQFAKLDELLNGSSPDMQLMAEVSW